MSTVLVIKSSKIFKFFHVPSALLFPATLVTVLLPDPILDEVIPLIVGLSSKVLEPLGHLSIKTFQSLS